jgi:hypothetical protein
VRSWTTTPFVGSTRQFRRCSSCGKTPGWGNQDGILESSREEVGNVADHRASDHCPVLTVCSDTAEQRHESWGVWGAMDFQPQTKEEAGGILSIPVCSSAERVSHSART